MKRVVLVVLPLALLLGAALVAGLALGRVRLPLRQTVRVLAAAAGFSAPHAADDKARRILLDVRLPRVLLGMVVGGVLALAGCLMQGLFRNPLADPGVLGVSAGGALGAVAAIHLGWAATNLYALPVSAFVTAMIAAALVYGVAVAAGGARTETLLLAGIALGSLAGAMTSLFIVRTREFALQDMVFWMMGGLSGASWPMLQVAAAVALVGSAVALCFCRELNVLLTGEEAAAAVGVDVAATRLLLLALASLLTGVAVAAAGVVIFVGLVVPHLLRLLIGPDHRVLLPASLLGGAAFLAGADVLAQRATLVGEVPLGVVTSLVGAPFFIYLLLLRRGGAGAS